MSARHRAHRMAIQSRAVAWALYFRIQIHRRPLPELAAFANDVPARPSAIPPARASWRAIDAAFAASVRLPEAVTGASICLVQSLVALRLLRACGEHGTLLIGLPSTTAAEPWRAHAWVDHPRNPQAVTFAAVVPVPVP